MSKLSNVKSILVIKSHADYIAYVREFQEYLEDEYLVISENALNELSVSFISDNVFNIENETFKRTDNCLGYSIYSKRPIHVRVSSYRHKFAKGFIETNLINDNIEYKYLDNNNESELPLPIKFLDSNLVELLDSNRNDYRFDQDTKFSYSCGYYDSEQYTVVDGDLLDIDDTCTLENGDVVHHDDAVWCESIEEYHLLNDCTQLENGEYLPDNQVITTQNGEHYGRDDEDITSCEGCNDYLHIDESYYSESDECSYCESCYSENSGLQNRLSYSSNVLYYKGFGDHQLNIKGDLVYLGFELETLCYDSSESELSEELYSMVNSNHTYDYCIPTEDGSLDGKHGVEFIFRPDNLENHSMNINHFIENIGDHLYDNAGDGYGLHVHVSNNWLSQFDRIKIQNFTSIFDDLFCIVGGRSSNRWAQKKIIAKSSDMKRGNNDRYQTVNLNPSETIEFRFPMSKVCHNHIMINLQLALSICLYCKYKCTYSNIENFYKYIDFISQYDEFKDLTQFFKSVVFEGKEIPSELLTNLFNQLI